MYHSNGGLHAGIPDGAGFAPRDSVTKALYEKQLECAGILIRAGAHDVRFVAKQRSSPA